MRVSRNISLLFIIKVAKWLMLYMPISFLFYKENGLGQQEYLTLHAIYSGVIALCEVPSGYVADVWGRKPTIMIGAILGSLGFGVYSFSYGIAGFLIAEILLGIGHSLLSGADTAILYDTLLEVKKEKRYLRLEGRITALGNISEAVAGIFVSVVILSQYRGYFVLQTLIAALAFVASAFLIEPKVHSQTRKAGFRDILGIVHHTFRSNKKLRNIIGFSSAIGFASLSMAWMAQPVMDELGLSERYFGVAWVALNTFVAMGSLSSGKVDRMLGLKGGLLFMLVPLSLGFIIVGLNLNYLGFVLLLFMFYIRGTAHPILKKHINNITESSQRATVFSLRSLLIRLLFFAIGPVLGFLSDKFSLKYALFLCGVSVIIPAIAFLILILLFRKRSE